jgi:hypothetical protein
MDEKGWDREDVSAVLCILSLLLIAVIGLGSLVAYAVGPRYDYNNAVGGHIANAYTASTPELMMAELDLAVEGMGELGLTDDMYARYWSWKLTPDKQMTYQYALIDAIKARCLEVISWRDNQDLMSGQIADVYAQKMDTIRGEIDRCDSIASNAYRTNIAPYYGVYVWLILWALGWVFCITLLILGLCDDDFMCADVMILMGLVAATMVALF